MVVTKLGKSSVGNYSSLDLYLVISQFLTEVQLQYRERAISAYLSGREKSPPIMQQTGLTHIVLTIGIVNYLHSSLLSFFTTSIVTHSVKVANNSDQSHCLYIPHTQLIIHTIRHII